MSKCEYCGRENGEAAVYCGGCGTPLEPDRPPTPIPRQLTASERKRGWVAVAVAGMCALVGWILAWRTSQMLRSLGSFVVTLGVTWAFFTLLELRRRNGNTQGDGTE